MMLETWTRNHKVKLGYVIYDKQRVWEHPNNPTPIIVQGLSWKQFRDHNAFPLSIIDGLLTAMINPDAKDKSTFPENQNNL